MARKPGKRRLIHDQVRSVFTDGGGEVEIVIMFAEDAPALFAACEAGDPDALATFRVLDSVVAQNLKQRGPKNLCLVCPREARLMTPGGEHTGAAPGFIKAVTHTPVNETGVSPASTVGFVICADCIKLERAALHDRLERAVGEMFPGSRTVRLTPGRTREDHMSDDAQQ